MPLVTVWSRGETQCVLFVAGSVYALRLMNGEQVQCEHRFNTADEALVLAEVLRFEPPPAASVPAPMPCSSRAAARATRAPRTPLDRTAVSPGHAGTAEASQTPRRYPMGVARGFM